MDVEQNGASPTLSYSIKLYFKVLMIRRACHLKLPHHEHTGSGKTYTMWGPTNSLSEEIVAKDQQGLTPRVFERLFARITEEQTKHSNRQLNYQWQCSFLEIYNEQITDLLDPNQRNLQLYRSLPSNQLYSHEFFLNAKANWSRSGKNSSFVVLNDLVS